MTALHAQVHSQGNFAAWCQCQGYKNGGSVDNCGQIYAHCIVCI